MGIYIAKCTVGWGVFAARYFQKEDFILAFGGRIIDFDEAVRKGPFEGNAIQIAESLYIDTEPPGVFVNHSCAPNAGVRDGNVLVALRDIVPEEEIRFDYSTTMAENSWEMDCLCGNAGCRLRIRDYRHLPAWVRRRYQAMRIVPRFAVHSCRKA